MAEKRLEAFEFTMQSGGINFQMQQTNSLHPTPLNVVVTISNSKATITLKALTIIVRALNEAKNQHYDGSDTNA